MENVNNLLPVGALTTPTLLLPSIPPGFLMVVLVFAFHKTAFFQKYPTQSATFVWFEKKLLINHLGGCGGGCLFFAPSPLSSLLLSLFLKL